MADINTAIIGFLGVVVGGFFNNFLAEDYRRYRDAQALAGALAGELESHLAAVPSIKKGLELMAMQAVQGKAVDTPEWPMASSPLFEQNAAKIGLLGPENAQEVAFVYENLRSFRQNFNMLTKHGSTQSAGWSNGIVLGCLAAITRSEDRGAALTIPLKELAGRSYWERPETRTQLKYGIGAFLVLLIAIKVLD